MRGGSRLPFGSAPFPRAHGQLPELLHPESELPSRAEVQGFPAESRSGGRAHGATAHPAAKPGELTLTPQVGGGAGRLYFLSQLCLFDVTT